MITKQYVYSTLSNGLRIVHCHMPQSAVGIFGVAVRAGSRNDPESLHGMAHFVEHTIFKGTDHRRAHNIINRMETVGGELNAYTTKEDTFVYSAFPANNLRRAVDLISDLVRNSRFPEREINREREVVSEEIDSYLDNPAEAVFDDFDDLIFAGTPLGHNILGTHDTLDRLTGDACRKFLTDNYIPHRMVAFYSGPASPGQLVRLVETYFADMGAETATTHINGPTADNNGAPIDESVKLKLSEENFDIRRDDDDNHQAHCVMGVTLPSLYSDYRFAISLYNNIVGGPGMNSLLNVALREKRGLVYSVDSSTTLYSDCGLLSIYFGCSPRQVGRCRRLVASVLQSLADRQLTPRQIDMAKRQLIGQTIVGSSSQEQTILSAARATLYRGAASTSDEIAAAITEVTSDQLLEVARMAAPDNLSILTLG